MYKRQGPKGDKEFTLLAVMWSIVSQHPVITTTNKSMINPGLIPVPIIDTPFSLAILSSSFASSGD